MTAKLSKATKIWHSEGSLSLVRKSIQWGYNTYLRPLFPRCIVLYNDIPVRASRIGDSIVPWQERDIPGYEDALIRGIRQYVKKGDTVVIVGGGWGISTVAAAHQTGERSNVVTYEGGEESVEKVTDTVQLNSVNDQVSIRHTVVGDAVSLRGDGTDAKVVLPVNLPECDVLVLDCEGAETEILEKMEIRPNAIIVETHGMYGAPEADVQNKLTSIGYDIVESMVAEERLRGVCEENSIYVLHATI